MPKINKGMLISAYVYCALHIAAWVFFLNSNGNEAWDKIFYTAFSIIFFPIWVLTFTMGELVWGSAHMFEANYVFGMFVDYAVLSVISIHMLIAVFIVVSNLLRRERNLNFS